MDSIIKTTPFDNNCCLQDWEVRLMFERSRAVKCPSIALQLAGCKKVQQELAAPGAVERFIKDRDVCDRIRNTFAGQYTLDLVSVTGSGTPSLAGTRWTW